MSVTSEKLNPPEPYRQLDYPAEVLDVLTAARRLFMVTIETTTGQEWRSRASQSGEKVAEALDRLDARLGLGVAR